ncbi:MAG: AAA family ATPase [Acidobacteriota bacterium]
MYEEFYGFYEKPFTLTPDPKFFFMSEDHFSALEHLLFGINQGEGFLVLAGGVGTGKTTLSKIILDKVKNNYVTSLILNPFVNEIELLSSIIYDFGCIPEGVTKKELIDQLNFFLLKEVAEKGKRAILIIDEAQNLSFEVLEQIRILSNLETDKEKLIQILLVGQEELLKKLARPELRQLNGRIPIKYYLLPLKKKEIESYILHRLRVAGMKKKLDFSKGAIKEIYKFSKGIPRQINIICDRALLAGFVKNTYKIKKEMIKKARRSLVGEKEKELKNLLKREKRFFFTFFKKKYSININNSKEE